MENLDFRTSGHVARCGCATWQLLKGMCVHVKVILGDDIWPFRTASGAESFFLSAELVKRNLKRKRKTKRLSEREEALIS